MPADPGIGGPDATTLAGLLADPDRRLVFAGLVLGDTTVEELVRTTGLTTERAATALARLTSGGVVDRIDGRPHLLGEAFARAARAARQLERSAAEPSAPAGVSREAAKVFNAFVRDGRILQIPTAHAKRLVLLDWLSQDFEAGRTYSEAMVNLILGRRHADTAAWRRFLVDEGFLSRQAGTYWRSGGTVPTGPDAS